MGNFALTNLQLTCPQLFYLVYTSGCSDRNSVWLEQQNACGKLELFCLTFSKQSFLSSIFQKEIVCRIINPIINHESFVNQILIKVYNSWVSTCKYLGLADKAADSYSIDEKNYDTPWLLESRKWTSSEENVHLSLWHSNVLEKYANNIWQLLSP